MIEVTWHRHDQLWSCCATANLAQHHIQAIEYSPPDAGTEPTLLECDRVERRAIKRVEELIANNGVKTE